MKKIELERSIEARPTNALSPFTAPSVVITVLVVVGVHGEIKMVMTIQKQVFSVFIPF